MYLNDVTAYIIIDKHYNKLTINHILTMHS